MNKGQMPFNIDKNNEATQKVEEDWGGLAT